MPHARLSLFPALLLSAVLAACTGGGDSDSPSSSSGSGSGSSSSSSGGASCNYTDLVTSSERAQANACGIQVSSLYGNADSVLQSAIAACQQGSKSQADSYYNANYARAVKAARDTSSALSCGSSSNIGITQPSAQTYYNMCGRTSAQSGLRIQAACYGPVRRDQGGCGNFDGTYINQHSSSSACISARDSWLNASR